MLDTPLPTLQNLLDGMAARMRWRIAAPILVRCGAPRARGWDLLREKIKAEAPKIDIDQLSDAFIDHILHGEKASRFFPIDAEVITTIKEKFQSRKGFSNFPFASISVDISKSEPSFPTLCFIKEDGEGVALVYSSIRSIEKRQTVSIFELPEDARPMLSKYKELIGIKTKNYRAYDVLWIPHASSIMELRADFPLGTSTEGAEYAINEALQAFDVDVDSKGPSSPVDLFPIIKKIYNEADEGKVVELALHTSTGSFKHEKMRLNDVCLRVELYHSGGKGALSGAIELFKLAVQWEFGAGEGSTTPELFLNGSYRMLQGKGPGLETAIIRNCAGAQDYSFVRAKIDQYLKTDAI